MQVPYADLDARRTKNNPDSGTYAIKQKNNPQGVDKTKKIAYNNDVGAPVTVDFLTELSKKITASDWSSRAVIFFCYYEY